jgi:predicted dehydrogenase
MSRKLRLGLIGTGVAAHRLYLPAWPKLRSKLELVACTNRSRMKAEEYAALAGIPRVVDSVDELLRLEDVDAVLVSLPIDAQPAVVLAALGAGKAVLSEKPVAPSVAAGKKLLAQAKRYDVPWLVAENYAFMSHVLALQQWVAKGRLGEVRLCEVRQLTTMDARNPYFHTTWRRGPRFIGGFVVDGGVHLAHVLRRCFGTPVEVQSASAHLCGDLPPPDTAVATLRFEGGALGTWTSCFAARYDGPMLRVFGSKANAELYWDRVELGTHDGRVSTHRPRVSSFEAQFSHFADVVKRGAPPRVSATDAMGDLELIERIARGQHGPREKAPRGRVRASGSTRTARARD